jgi:hypothetical protein
MSHTKIIANTTNPTNKSAIAPIAAKSKVDRRMVGLSLHGWENGMVLSLIVAGFFALIAGAATWAVVRLTRLELADSKRELDAYKLTVESNVAEAKKEGIEAGKAAGNALVRAAESEKQTAELTKGNLTLQTNLERERIERLKLEEKLAPRSLSAAQRESIKAALTQFAGMRIDLIAFVQSSTPDTAPLAIAIGGILESARWRPKFWSTISTGAHITGILVSVREGSDSATLAAANGIVDILNRERLASSRWDAFNFRSGKLEEAPASGINGPPWDEADVAPIRMLIGTKP